MEGMVKYYRWPFEGAKDFGMTDEEFVFTDFIYMPVAFG
jgi:hypothetical protein